MIIKFNKRFALSFVIGVVYLLFMVSGDTSPESLYIGMLLLISWLIVAFITDIRRLRLSMTHNKACALIIFIVYVSISSVFVAPPLFIAKQAGALILAFSPILFYYYYKGISDNCTLKRMLMIISGGWFYFMIKALLFYQDNSEAARVLASDVTAYGDIAIGGGYSLAYGTAILIPVLISIFLKGYVPGFINNLIVMIFIFLGTLVVYKTGSTITFVMMSIGIAICIFEVALQKKVKFSNRSIYLFVVGLIGLAVFLLIIREPLGGLILEYTNGQGNALSLRLQSLAYFLIGGASESNANYFISRAMIPLQSLNTFFDNPLFGIVSLHGNGFFNPRIYGAGNHCEWADALCNYGIFFGIIFLYIYYKQVKEIQKDNLLTWSWVVVFVGMGMFNPLRTFQTNIVVFFIIPSINHLMKRYILQSNDNEIKVK